MPGRSLHGTRRRPRCVANQAFAWNPSITGTKSEDTILATDKGPALLTRPVDWPTLEVEFAGRTVPRADILVR